MKKFMAVVLIVGVIAMIGTIISFFIFDFSDFVLSGARWGKSFGYRVATEAGDVVSDIIVDTATENNEPSVERNIDALEQNVNRLSEEMEALTQKIVSGISEVDFSISGLTEPIYQAILSEVGMENGYVTEELIRKSRDEIIDRWTQAIDDINFVRLDMDNMNVVFAKTREKEFQFYVTAFLRKESNLRLRRELNDGVYRISDTKKGLSAEIKIGAQNNSYTLYVLIPEEYSGDLRVELDNGNIIGIQQKNSADLKLNNGNVIINQAQNMDLNIEVGNGNIIADFIPELNADLKLKVTNGLVIGFGFEAMADNIIGEAREHSVRRGQGLYTIKLATGNGNIIGH